MAVLARQEGGNLTGYDQYGPAARVALAGYSFWFYPWKLVWPAGLSPMYELPARVDPLEWRFLGPLVAVLVLTAILIALRRRCPGALAAWIHSALVLAPVAGIVHSGSQLAHDRYSYLSGMGFAVLAGGALLWAWRQRRAGATPWARPLALTAAALLVIALGAGAWRQAGTWRGSETLWRRAVAVDPTCSLCESNLGRVVARPGRFAEAEAHVRRAIALRPDRPGPYENMGVILLAQGRPREAEDQLRQAVALRPSASSRNNLGVALASQGRDAEAEAELREAERLSGRLVDAPGNLGALYLRQGRNADAIPPLRRALALDPGQPGARANLARALRGRAAELREANPDEAARLWHEASAIGKWPMTRARTRLLLLLVCACAFAAFLPALGAGFVDWDDDRNLVDNPNYRGLGPRQLQWMLTATWMGHYIPLTWVTFGLNFLAGGMDPRGYHLGNMLLHAASAGLFFLVARRLLARAGRPAAVDWGAAAAALLFALHPLRVESVAWVTERRDVLCAFFYLVAVLAYLRGVDTGGRLRGGWLAASLVAFAAALLSKAMAMTLPLTLLVMDVYPLRRRAIGWRALITEKLGHLALAAAAAAVASWAVTRGAAWTGYDTYGLGARLAMSAYAFWFYPWKLVWPVGLSPLYELPARVDLAETRFLWPAVAVGLVTIALVACRRRWPGALAAWVHSMIVLAPVSGVAHAGYQLAHDRYSYLSGLGFAVLAGGGIAWLIGQRERRRVSGPVFGAAMGGAALALVGLGIGTWEHTKIWRDSASLWTAAVAADPSCALCRHKLGNTLFAARRYREAEAELQRAARLRPERAGPHVSLGALLVEQGRYADADAELRHARELSPRSAEALANLGALRAREGRNGEAIALLRGALGLAPWLGRARVNLALALSNAGTERARAGRLDEATALFAEAAELLPEDANAWRNLGQALVEQGKPADAVAPLTRAVTLRPRGAAERFWLARAYVAGGRRADAEREIQALRELDPVGAAQLTATLPR